MDAGDFDLVGGQDAEEDAAVLGAKPVDRRIDALELLDVAFVGFQKAGQGTRI